MLERHELETFLTLAEELHFGRTGERMRVSTSRVSQTIAKLERRVGAPLFRRTSRRVELTAIGRRLYDDVRPAWDRIGVAFQRAVDSGRGVTGTLCAGFVNAAGSQLLAETAELFQRRHPECEVRIREVPPVDGVPWLRGGEVETLLAALPVQEPDLVTGPALVSERQMLAVPAGHRLARRDSVAVEDLAGAPLVRLPGTIAGPPPAVDVRGSSVATFHEALALVGAGRAVLLFGAHARRYHPRPDVVYLPVENAPVVTWGLVWRADGATARVRAFVQAAHDLVRTTA
ncbi:LysR family transcriptional regulator [Streptomyces sp. NPDC001816]|uniref:LysR family transcriptional regulator n=1 Tax=Streptomyces sp. NPDC001816 TaxID=3364612 RepID=UPI0036752DC9